MTVTLFFFWRLFFDKNVVPAPESLQNMDRLVHRRSRDGQDLPRDKLVIRAQLVQLN